jgi:prevent-host-death family protein
MAKNTPTDRTRTIADVKAHFAECIREAEAGHTILVSRHGRPVAKLAPLREDRRGHDLRQPDEVAEKPVPYAAEESIATSTPSTRRAALRALLEKEIWPRVPKSLLGAGVTKREREEILGYAPSTGTSSKHGTRGRR